MDSVVGVRSQFKPAFALFYPLVFIIAAFITACTGEIKDPDPGTIGDGRFEEIVRELVVATNIPALTVVISKDGEIIDSASAGLRSFEQTVSVTEEDQWQIGSLTKAITATLAARLIELGQLQWDSSIGEIFSEYSDQINSRLHDITLADLLQHRSGLRRDLEPTNQEKTSRNRMGFVLRGLEKRPRFRRGEQNYSNLGFVTAGVIIEKVTGMSWEQAVDLYLLSELDITHYGFGVPDPGTDLLQPVGHIRRIDNTGERVNDYWFAVEPGINNEASGISLIGPAGSLYMSKQDYLKFQLLHLNGANGGTDFLSQDSFNRLQVPENGLDYAMGWQTWEGNDLSYFKLSEDENLILHSGSIGTWLAHSLLLPDRNISIFIASNSETAYFETTLNVLLKRLQITD